MDGVIARGAVRFWQLSTLSGDASGAPNHSCPQVIGRLRTLCLPRTTCKVMNTNRD